MKQTINDLILKMQATKRGGWQYLEVKQLAEILARHREKVRWAVREYRMHKRTHAAEHDAIEKLYLGYEGMFLRDHLRDSIRLYVLVNRDYHEAYQAYMAGLKAPQEVKISPIIMMDGPQKTAPLRRKSAA